MGYQLKEVVGGIKKPNNGSQKMEIILDTLTSIAEQTNLLAFNSAIDAAREGEQNREFTFIAEQIKRLSEQSEKTAGEVLEFILSGKQENVKVKNELAHRA